MRRHLLTSVPPLQKLTKNNEDFFFPVLSKEFFCLAEMHHETSYKNTRACIQRARGRGKADKSDLHAPLTYSFCICREN